MIMKSHTPILLGKDMVALHVTTENRDFMIYQNQASYEDIFRLLLPILACLWNWLHHMRYFPY